MNPKNKTLQLTKDQAGRSKKWILLDAKGKTLGRFASEVTKILRGKHRPDYTPHIDCGDGVVIINADLVTVTGMKEARKIYREYTGYIGGLRETPYRVMMARKPSYILNRAIRGMMPKTRLGQQQLRHLRVYTGNTHPMQAQQPVHVNA
jgi:large subunit ribosomal protein L13